MVPAYRRNLIIHGYEFYRFIYIYLTVGSTKRNENFAANANFRHGIRFDRLDYYTIYLKDYERINLFKKCKYTAT